MMCSTQTQRDSQLNPKRPASPHKVWLEPRHGNAGEKPSRILAYQNGFNDLASVSCSTQLPSFGHGNHHPVWWTQFLLVPPCLTPMVVSTRGCWSKAPQQDAKTQGLDTFEVYPGATVLAFNRKLSCPWLKCIKKPTNSSVLCHACYLLTPDIQVDQDDEENHTANQP